MEPLTSVVPIAAGIGGAIAILVGALLAANFDRLASRLQTAAERAAVRWPSWLRMDEWGRSVPAIRLYGAGLAFVSGVLVVAALPHSGGRVGQYVTVVAFLAFLCTWLALSVGALRFLLRSHRWRYVSAWNIAVLSLQLTIFGLSLTVSAVHS